MNQRLYYLDNLKVCLTVLVIMHHSHDAIPVSRSNMAQVKETIQYSFNQHNL